MFEAWMMNAARRGDSRFTQLGYVAYERNAIFNPLLPEARPL